MHDEDVHKNLSLRKDNTYFLSKMVLFSFVHHSRKVVSDKKQVIFNDAAFLVFFPYLCHPFISGTLYLSQEY